jgi:hypothetical protein
MLCYLELLQWRLHIAIIANVTSEAMRVYVTEARTSSAGLMAQFAKVWSRCLTTGIQFGVSR